MQERVVALLLVAAGTWVGIGCEHPVTAGGQRSTTGDAPSTTAVASAPTVGGSATTGGAGASTGGGAALTSGEVPSASGGALSGGALSGGAGASTSGSAAPGTPGGAITDAATAGPQTGGAEGGMPGVDAGGDASDAAGRGAPPLGEAHTLVPDPSWDCGLPEGIVPPTLGAEVFRGAVALGSIHALGQTQFGERRLIEFSGGSLEGASFDGEFLEGALDWELSLPTGSMEIEQVGVLRMSDGTAIYYRACGVSPTGSDPARMVADFEAPNSSDYAWLNTGTYVGVREVDAESGVLEMAFYDVDGVSAPDARLIVTDPQDLPHQAWECPERSGSEGAQVFRESVGIGSTIRVGASKRGTRTIIPITGGSVTGMMSGAVLKGGADYQLSGDGFTLDARYTLRSDDNVLILVRNCGAASGLVPEFETRADGPYAFLNHGSYLSSSPGLGLGSVNLTIYERR